LGFWPTQASYSGRLINFLLLPDYFLLGAKIALLSLFLKAPRELLRFAM
jgi:hypothetical protein